MAQEEQVENLRKICRECIETPIDDLIAKREWGSINFEGVRPQLELAFSLCEDLLRCPIKILPPTTIDAVISSAEVFLGVLTQIRRFDITTGVPNRRRNEIISHVSSTTDDFFTQTLPWVTYLAYSHGDSEVNASKLSDAAERSEIILGKIEKEFRDRREVVDEIITATKEAAAETGVAHFTQDFRKEAEKLRSSSNKWLAATIILTVATIVAAYYLFTNEKADNWFSIIHTTTTRLIILGTLITATIWCGKVYKACQHQVTINMHRANAIKTFQAFAQAASNEAVRDAVLLETTKAIFGPRPSGYLDQELISRESDQTRIIKVPARPPNASE